MVLGFLYWSVSYPAKIYDETIKKGKFEDPRFESMFGEYKATNPAQIYFNTIFMLRRLLYGLIIIFLMNYPLAQAFSFTMI